MSSDGEPQILVRALTKRYRSTRRRPLARLLGRGSPREARPALAELSFEVARGQALGVIGRNGSGKSTLLRVLAAALPATSGDVEVRGRVASLLDLTSGINPEFSGSENAVVLGMLAGHSRAQMNERMEEIRAFSGLGDAFDEPVKEYSAGMTLRLGFSAAVHTDPDVLLIDEALAVGDAFFQQRCLRRMREFRESGKTIVLVSHDPSAILSLCDRALWLEGGGCAALGDPEDVVRSYLAARYRDDCAIDSPLVAEGAPASPDDALQPAPPLASEAERFGDGRARIVGVAVRDDRGAEIDAVRPGQRVEVVITARARAELRSPLIGFTLRNRLGDVTTATNTEHAGYELGPLAAGESITVAFELGWPPLASGPVALSPAIADGAVAGHRMCDWVENPLVLHAENPRALFGWMSLEEVGLRAHREGAPVPEARIDEEADDTAERRILGAVDQPRDTGVPSADLGRDASLYVSGWAFASDGAPVEVEIRLGDGEPVCTPCRTFRGDVGAFHTSTPAAGRSGFGARVPSPGPGPARLRVEARSGSSRHLLDERELQLAPAGDPPGPATARRPPPRRAPAEPPHVLWLSHRLELEGAPRSLLEVAASLRDRYRMTVVSPSDGPLRKDWEAAGIPVVVEPFEIHDSVDDYEATIRRLAALRSAEPPDLVVANTLDAFWGVDLARELAVPSVWVVRESEPPETYFLDRWPRAMADRATLGFSTADRLLFVAHATERLFRGVASPAARAVVWNGIDHERLEPLRRKPSGDWRSELRLPPDRTILLCVGTPCYRKGQLVLLEALDRLREGGDPPCCVFLGVREGDYLDAMRERIEELELEDHVELRPETSEPLGYYAAADVLVCPSYQESLPRVVMEAAAFGLPIVASDVDGVPELVRHDREALLVRAGDGARLADALARLRDDPRLAEALGEAARRRSRRDFSLAGCSDRLDRMFRELLAERAAGGA